ncbi:MAG: outer membrane beta-barrel protein [Thiohalomonadaceae bacterium]
MLNYRRWICGVVTALGMVASQGVAARYYLGVEAGHEHLSSRPEYSFVSGKPNQTFDNQAHGSSIGVIGGYHWKTTKDFSLDVQGRLSVSDTTWKMTLPEPASFRYDIPVNVAISLLPSFHFTKNFAAFAEAGLALGKIRERKSTVTTSQYNIEKWRPGIVVGLGMSLALDERWSMRAGYRHTWYKNHDFNTYSAVNGMQVESVTSRVKQSMTTIGLIREF